MAGKLKLHSENNKLANDILKKPSDVGNKLIEIADNLHSLATIKNNEDIEFCSKIIQICAININIARYNMFTEIMGIKLKELSEDDVKDIVLNIKELIKNLDNRKQNYKNLFESIKNVYFSCQKISTF